MTIDNGLAEQTTALKDAAVRRAMAAARITLADLTKPGIRTWVTTTIHAECGGTGVQVAVNNGVVMIRLCACFKVHVVRQL